MKPDNVASKTLRAIEGSTVVMTCGPGPPDLHNSTVSWLRSDSLQILSVGYLVFTHDNRFSITNTWDLVISRLKQEDSGDYECQVVDRRQESMTPHVVKLVIDKEKYQDVHLQKDAPSQLENNDDIRGRTNNERDKTLNKLMETQTFTSLSSQENISWSKLQLPITSVLVLSAIVLLLGLVRIIGSWKKTNTTQIARNGSVKNEDSIEELPALEVVEKCDRAKITVNVTTI